MDNVSESRPVHGDSYTHLPQAWLGFEHWLCFWYVACVPAWDRCEKLTPPKEGKSALLYGLGSNPKAIPRCPILRQSVLFPVISVNAVCCDSFIVLVLFKIKAHYLKWIIFQALNSRLKLLTLLCWIC